MLMIRLQRVGRRNHAEFRVVVTEHARAAKSASYVEVVGNYNPHTNSFTVDKEKVEQHMKNGAKLSDTVHNLMVSNKIIKGDKINVLPKKTPIVKEAEAPAEPEAEKTDEAAPEEAPVEEEKEEVKEEAAA